MSLLAKPTMVSDFAITSVRFSADNPPTEESSIILPEREPSVDPERDTPLSLLETLRSGFNHQGFLREVANLLLAGSRPSHSPLNGIVYLYMELNSDSQSIIDLNYIIIIIEAFCYVFKSYMLFLIYLFRL